MKCKVAKAVTIARMKDPFCRDCFDVYFTHRFRATFGKAKIVRQGEEALLCFSGGTSSRVLLKLVENGLQKDAVKKLRFIPTIIYVDESVVLEQDQLNSLDQSAYILSIAAQTGFAVLYTRLEEVFGSCGFWYLHDLIDQFKGTQPLVQFGGRRGVSDKSEEGQRLESSHPCLVSIEGESKCEEERPVPSPHVSLEEMFEKHDNKMEMRGSMERGMQLDKERKESEIYIQDEEQTRVQEEIVEHIIQAGIVRLPSSSENNFSAGPVKPDYPSHFIKDSIEATCLTISHLQEQIKEVFAAAQSVTAKESLLFSLRRKLIVKIALSLKFTKVLVGDNASQLSVRLLGNIAQGRGGTIPLDTGFCDDRGEVMILRPLREFPRSEVLSYAELYNLEAVELTSMIPEKTSIERLTESFINGLQTEFPSTISTVFRTGDKLSLNENTETTSNTCPLCQVPCGTCPDEDVFCHIRSSPQKDTFWSDLCYGCRLTMKDLKCTPSVLYSLGKLKNS